MLFETQGHPTKYWPDSNILQANAGGDAADYFDELCQTDRDTLKSIILNRLNDMYPGTVVDDSMLLEFECTWWSQSQNFRGAWFQFGPEATPDDYDTLFERQGNLFFSGESACRRYYGFYHGALIAAWRDANIILDEANNSVLWGPPSGKPYKVTPEDRCEALPPNNGNAVPRSRVYRNGGGESTFGGSGNGPCRRRGRGRGRGRGNGRGGC